MSDSWPVEEDYAHSVAVQTAQHARHNAMERAVRATVDGVAYEGGSTASVTGEAVPETGYMVGGLAEECVVGWLTEAVVEYYISHNSACLDEPGVYLGGWRNPDNDKVYLDISEHFTSLDAALAVAELRHEIAVFDLSTKSDINVAEEIGK